MVTVHQKANRCSPPAAALLPFVTLTGSDFPDGLAVSACVNRCGRRQEARRPRVLIVAVAFAHIFP